MARSTTRSLAGKAASAARKAVGRRRTAAPSTPASGGAKNGKAAVKKTAAKSAP